MTVQEATYYLLDKLRNNYDESEASQITDWIMEAVTGSKKTERMLYKKELLAGDEEKKLKEYTERLLRNEPVQYVLNEAWFCGLKLFVTPAVLVPRPETEELVEWVIANCKFPLDELKILDIGTGSGCIAIALKRRLRRADVWACDNHTDALEIAKKNAASLGTPVHFVQLDFLDKGSWLQLPSFDIIVSNPPYIPFSDKNTMAPNVVEYEPAAALFVPNDDPLIFYKAIAEFGKTHLKKQGAIFSEIHEDLGSDSAAVFRDRGYTTELKKDMQQKDRMIKSGLV